MHQRTAILFFVFVAIASCKNDQDQKTLLIKNNLDFERREVISIRISDIFNVLSSNTSYVVRERDSTLTYQLFDSNNDSIPDELLLYVGIGPMDEKQLTVKLTDEASAPNKTVFTYSRFVPERTDDYTWENDFVAFRTYGPTAQRLIEEKKPGGTLSSGLDCWLKRVHYPIIDKWYKKYTDGGTYHQDDGEGYDPYHVGKSRGCGGIGVWKDDSLYVSRNFISYRKVVDGPLRNVFELTYAPWNADGALVHETKRITVDAGNQLYKIEEILYTDKAIPNITIGITLHDQKGTVSTDSTKGIYGYWEPIDDSELGTGVVIDPATVISYRDYRTQKKDLSHLYVMVKPVELISYYTGFAWKKANEITTAQAWEKYLGQFTQRLQSPLSIQVKQ
jgi:hypothetical protein